MPKSPASAEPETAGVATIGPRSPVFLTTRTRPGRSVTSISPSGRNAIPQGTSKPLATTSTLMAAVPSVPYPFSTSSQPGAAAGFPEELLEQPANTTNPNTVLEIRGTLHYAAGPKNELL